MLYWQKFVFFYWISETLTDSNLDHCKPKSRANLRKRTHRFSHLIRICFESLKNKYFFNFSSFFNNRTNRDFKSTKPKDDLGRSDEFVIARKKFLAKYKTSAPYASITWQVGFVHCKKWTLNSDETPVKSLFFFNSPIIYFISDINFCKLFILRMI